MDSDRKIVNINQAGREILQSELSGDLDNPVRNYEVFYPDGRPFPVQELPLRIAMEEQRVVNNVETLIHKSDGSQTFLLSGAAPVFDDDGNLINGIVVFQDISEYKQAQEKADLYSRALEILHQVDKTILDIESIDNLSSRVLPLVNKMFSSDQISLLSFKPGDTEAEVLGLLKDGEKELRTGRMVPLGPDWPPADLIEHELIEIETPKDFPVNPDLREVLVSEKSEVFICVPLVERGNLIGTLNVSLTLGENPPEVFLPVVVQAAHQLAIGIRQARLVETQERYTSELEILADQRAASLIASEARFQTVFEDAAFGIATLDEDMLVIDSNDALHKILGFSEAEIAGKSLLRFSHPEDVESEADLFNKLSTGELRYFKYEGRFIRKDGKVRWGKYTVSRIKEDKHENYILAIALMEDFTDVVTHQEALLSAERFAIAGRLGTSLAHEINNPLQAVLGSLGLVEEMIDDREALRFISVAVSELERSAKIVEQLRNLGRPVIQSEKQLVDINDLVEKTLMMTRNKMENTKISQEWQKTEDLPLVKAAPEQIQQVLLNLVINAIQAMSNGGNLEVSTSVTESPEGILIVIGDDGTGISEDAKEKLFEPFYSTRPNGLGLGLYLSHEIVQAHNGIIQVDSEEGVGTKVKVWLPVEEGSNR